MSLSKWVEISHRFACLLPLLMLADAVTLGANGEESQPDPNRCRSLLSSSRDCPEDRVSLPVAVAR